MYCQTRQSQQPAAARNPEIMELRETYLKEFALLAFGTFVIACFTKEGHNYLEFLDGGSFRWVSVMRPVQEQNDLLDVNAVHLCTLDKIKSYEGVVAINHHLASLLLDGPLFDLVVMDPFVWSRYDLLPPIPSVSEFLLFHPRSCYMVLVSRVDSLHEYEVYTICSARVTSVGRSTGHQLANGAMFVFRGGTTNEWTRLATPPSFPEGSSCAHISIIGSMGTLYTLFSDIVGSVGHIWTYNIHSDTWQDTYTRMDIDVIGLPQLVLCKNNLLAVSIRFPDQVQVELEVIIIFAGNNGRILSIIPPTIFERIYWDVLRPDGRGLHVFGYSEFLVLLSPASGNSLVYNWKTSFWEILPATGFVVTKRPSSNLAFDVKQALRGFDLRSSGRLRFPGAVQEDEVTFYEHRGPPHIQLSSVVGMSANQSLSMFAEQEDARLLVERLTESVLIDYPEDLSPRSLSHNSIHSASDDEGGVHAEDEGSRSSDAEEPSSSTSSSTSSQKTEARKIKIRAIFKAARAEIIAARRAANPNIDPEYVPRKQPVQPWPEEFFRDYYRTAHLPEERRAMIGATMPQVLEYGGGRASDIIKELIKLDVETIMDLKDSPRALRAKVETIYNQIVLSTTSSQDKSHDSQVPQTPSAHGSRSSPSERTSQLQTLMKHGSALEQEPAYDNKGIEKLG